jgi:MerR family transcriptional regulator, mercuric resistance operon regulatory protein
VGATPPLRSGDLARLLGISPDTLRLYERKGLLPSPPRAANGYRAYPPDLVNRIRLIRSALSVGFTLDELAKILAMRDGDGVPCGHVRDLAGAKLDSLNRHIRQLEELRQHLKVVLKQWDSAVKKTPKGQRAGLLESLATQPPRSRKLSPRLYSALAEHPLTGRLYPTRSEHE